MTPDNTISLESEVGFRTLFENATIGILVMGHGGNIELMNPNAEKLFGYSNAELIGRPIEILMPESHHTRHRHHRDSYFESPKSRPMGTGMDLHARKKDGSVFPVEISLGYYELTGEKLALAFVTDITKRKEAENKLNKLNEELEQRILERTLELTAALEREKELNELKSRFVAMASHEFRTPLSTILSSIFLVEGYTETGQQEKRAKHIGRIKESVHNLVGILNDFLSLEKLEQGKIEVDFEVINLSQFCADLADGLKGMLKEGQKITYFHTGAQEVCLDKKICRNILLNLLSNGIKYSPEGKEINLTTDITSGRVLVEVKDSGIGIPEEEQKHLFSKYYRAKNAAGIQGTGLGLNIVQRYVELLGGNITFTSKLNEGTVFTVQFPQNIK